MFTARRNALPRWNRQNSGACEAEDSSKIKDRLEALLYAETLQGTLSPNANPGRGSIGGLLNLMPKAAARIRKQPRHVFTCPLSICYTKVNAIAQGG